jgi:hypothetical protein
MAEDQHGLESQVSVRPYRDAGPLPSPATSETSLQRVQGGVAELEATLRQGHPVAPALLEELAAANDDLAGDLAGPGEIDLIEQAAVVSAASRQYELLNQVLAHTPPEDAAHVVESLASAAGVLQQVGAPTPLASAAARPGASPSATSSPQPTPWPTPTPTP